MKKDALQAAQELEILTGLKLYREEERAMIDKILEFSVRQRVLVLMGAVALLLVGLWSATNCRWTRFRTSPACKCKSTRRCRRLRRMKSKNW